MDPFAAVRVELGFDSAETVHGLGLTRAIRRESRRTKSTARRSLLLLSIAAMIASIVVAAPSHANEAPFRSLDAAIADLAKASGELADTQAALEAARNELLQTSVEREFLSSSDSERVATLEHWRRRARRLAVEAYIGGPDVAARVYFVDPEHAADVAYRSMLLQEHTRSAVTATIAYSTLIDTSDDALVDLALSIDEKWAVIESLENDVGHAEARVDAAKWVVYIAEIHAIADEEFSERGRREPTETQWHELRMCESTNTYEVNTGNGFYGAYQFDYTTWFTVGGEPDTRADMARPEEQDARARLLFSRRGSQPWPVCGRFLDR